ncbi:dipeptide ABC transporter ATP-binding protein [Clostridium sp. 'deep sea']|uniref:ABC transporter ATP-binding protein n=1 Tax=Clostridium sp. 'deep sea' TaxID=2779445 RepID=UPI0018964E99|nr:dipeptide ABC transporter ATP-binding protein [Clostridium sp. 'deep sea']QOR34047.1 dipeptide ABC transporter ATP-binding protein [Clostridium sp. 'deep sea']
MSKLLEVKDLKKHYPISVNWRKQATVKAVDGVSFSLQAGETLGLVGESGCGKSTTGMSVLRLTEPTSGEVFFEGENICKLNSNKMRLYRKKMQIVFQDPFASLNPRWKIGNTIAEALEIHKLVTGKEKNLRVEQLLDRVGIDPSYKNRYPHEFSGGQRQRIGIARALAVKPQFVVCDEPVSALDVSVQAQVINLLQDLQKELALSYLFIAHDLGVVRHICDRVAVMYLGKIVELANTEDLYTNAQHPYTKALLSAVPVPDPLAKRNEIVLTGDIPSPLNPPTGCSFHPRCPYAKARCKETAPELINKQNKHSVSCHFAGKLGGK